jgi:hypothetical protein
MKKNIKIIFGAIAILAIALSSCQKSMIDTPNQVGISKVTYYANMVLNGNQYMSIVKGSTFTDPGATATAEGQTLTVTTSGTVDVNTPGIYNITYTAVNKDGFPASLTRTVAVLSMAEQAGVDISGEYIYVGSSYTSTVTKLAPGFYSTDNCWGGSSIPAMFICTDGKNIEIPQQTAGGYGLIAGSGTLTSSGALTYTVTLFAYGISDAVRKWQKQ